MRILVAALAALALLAPAAAAQTFPTRPVTLIVPFPAGGPSDALARILAQAMAAPLKQTVVVENVAGAGGTIGLARLANAAPDGQVIGFGTVGTHVANVALYATLPYDPQASFAPVGLAGIAPTILVATPALPVASLKDLVARAAAEPGKLNFGSAGVGSVSHVACALLLSATGSRITHVPYRGVAPAMSDVIAGHVDVMCDQTTTALPQAQAGKIKVLAVLAGERLPQLPEVGTAREAGYDLDLRAWNALFAPKGTPPAVIATLNGALRAAAADPAVAAQLAAVGVGLPQGDALDPARVTALIAEGLARDVPVLRARGERLD